jgi:hypothetical protein
MKDYASHSLFVVGFHLVLGSLLVIGTVVSLVNI